MNIYSPVHQRRIPPSALLSLFLGGPFNQIAWVVLLFGLTLSAAFLRHSEVVFLFLNDGDAVVVSGVLRDIQATSFSENKSRIQKYSFEFPWQGKTEQGVSFSKGKSFTVGQDLTVRVPKDRPELAVIEGFRRKPFGKEIGFLALFPIGGLLFLVVGFFKNLRLKKLLEVGDLTVGRLKESTPTNTRINGKRVIRYTFEFKTPDGQTRTTTASSHLWAGTENGAEEPIIYNQANPEQAYVISKLPMEVSLGDSEVRARGFSPLILILPACSLLLIFLLSR